VKVRYGFIRRAKNDDLEIKGTPLVADDHKNAKKGQKSDFVREQQSENGPFFSLFQKKTHVPYMFIRTL